METLTVSQVVDILQDIEEDYGDISVLYFDGERDVNEHLDANSFFIENKKEYSTYVKNLTENVVSICP